MWQPHPIFNFAPSLLFDPCSHKVDRERVMKFYPISFPGIIIRLPSAVMPIKHIWADDSKHEGRKAGRAHTRVTAATQIQLHISAYESAQTQKSMYEHVAYKHVQAFLNSIYAHKGTQTHALTPKGDEGQTGLIVSSSRSREHIDFSHTLLSTHLPLILLPPLCLSSYFSLLPFPPRSSPFCQIYFFVLRLLSFHTFSELYSLIWSVCCSCSFNCTLAPTSDTDLHFCRITSQWNASAAQHGSASTTEMPHNQKWVTFYSLCLAVPRCKTLWIDLCILTDNIPLFWRSICNEIPAAKWTLLVFKSVFINASQPALTHSFIFPAVEMLSTFGSNQDLVSLCLWYLEPFSYFSHIFGS